MRNIRCTGKGKDEVCGREGEGRRLQRGRNGATEVRREVRRGEGREGKGVRKKKGDYS